MIAIQLIAYATLVVTGGRLGDIHGTKNVFLAGVFGFSVTSQWCGLAQSGPDLIAARLAQGATAALMVPQVLATLHLLFSDTSRSRAFRRCAVRADHHIGGAADHAVGAAPLFAASALFALSIVACAAFLSWMRHALPPDTHCLNP